MSPDAVVGVILETDYLNGRVTVADHMVKEWKGTGKVGVHKVYEIFLPRQAYDAREAYRWGSPV